MIALRTNPESASRNGTETMLKHRPSLTTMQGTCTMANKPDITPELLRQLIRFDEITGKYFWLTRPVSMFDCARVCITWNKKFAGKEAFATLSDQGYLKGGLMGRTYKAHRVIWAYHYGEWPSDTIDHINGVRTDNRIQNLRVVSQSENLKNAARKRNNSSGCGGVHWDKVRHKWQARINVEGKTQHIGMFENLADAIVARRAASLKYGYHANHGRTA